MKKSRLLIKILGYTKRSRTYLILSAVFTAAAVAALLLLPVLVGKAIDNAVGAGAVDMGAVLRYAIGVGVCALIGAVFQWLATASTNALAFRSAQRMRKDLFAHIDKLPLSYLDNRSVGDMTARLSTDIDQISDGLLQGFTQLFGGVVTIAGTIGLMLAVNPLIALVVILLTPLSLFVSYFIAKRTHGKFTEQQRLRGAISGYAEETLGGSAVVQAFRRQEACAEEFAAINGQLYDVGVKAQFYSAMVNPCTRFINNLVYAAVGVTGACTALLTGAMTAGTLTTFLMYANQYTKPFNEITGVITELQTAVAAAERFFATLEAPTEADDSQNLELTRCAGEVNLSNVYFSYTPERPLIENFNLDVTPGQKVAIVGPTGCGKTTLINLLMRFYDADNGTIYVDKIPIHTLTRAGLRGCYGMVLQDTWLFSGTIRDNIAYSKPDAPQDEIEAAAKRAGCHGFIETFEKGYDTVLEENGASLSQGQRQLLCIARIMLLRPPMLILDEATSNIDTRTELKIQQAFSDLTKGKTSFTVAHRLSTIREADMILVMNKGNVVEQGTHEQLLARRGFYYELYNSQFEE